jgi:hypothetical protein
MPFTGSVDLTEILDNLGDPHHGLKADPKPTLNPKEQKEDLIYQATLGPVDMSTQTALEGAWDLIWDVNGYYRALGVGWPFRARKIDLRVAYQERGGKDSEYLTYVLKQLLDPEVRAAYDKTPLGKRFRDKYLELEEERLAAKVAQELSETTGKLITKDDLVRDINEEREKDLLKELPKLDPILNIWNWGYYLLKSRKNEYDNLIEWQRLLTKAFAAEGLVQFISIGYIGNTEEEFVIKQWNGKTIFFINEGTSPSLELAETAVSQNRSLNGRK